MSLRLVRADEPHEACENVDLRRVLARLTLGTHDQERGFVLLSPESRALYEVLAHRGFSPIQFDQVERVIRQIDPCELDSDWDDRKLEAFVTSMRSRVERPEWIDLPIQLLHAAMRSQEPRARFRLWYTRAVLVAFLTVDFLPTQPEDLALLAG